MNCPSCGAPMRLPEAKECFLCDYCGNIHFPETIVDGVRLLEESSALACPVCRVPLMHAAIDHHRMLYCTRCRGMLIPMPVFLFLVQDLRALRAGAAETAPKADAHDLRRRIHCPQCHRLMDTHFYAGPGNVIIDDCSPCELNWLDSGELLSIVRAPDHSLDERSETYYQTSPNWELPH